MTAIDTNSLKDRVRVTYALKYAPGLNLAGRCGSVLYDRNWWDRRKAETGDPTGRKVMEEAFAMTIMCPYTITDLQIDEHPQV